MDRHNTTVRLTDSEQFFYDHAGWSYDPATETKHHGRATGAIALADAERMARARGWTVRWEIDPDADTTPTEDYFVSGNPQWIAILANSDSDDAEVLSALGGIDFAEAYEVTPERDPYARVVAAELALEVLWR